MGCRIIEGTKDGRNSCAVFYCSTTEWAFGPVMEDHEEAMAFTEYLKGHPSTNGLLSGDCDPRAYSDRELESLFAKFRQQRKEVGVIE